jgi:glycerate dehydrogenase
MRIVVLDGYTLNPGDLSWGELEQLGKCEFYDRSSPSEVISRSKDADAVLTNKVVFDQTIIEALPRLRYIGVTATGYNIVDAEAAKSRKITVTNVPAYSTQEVAQFVFALILELTSHIGHHDRTVHEGRWSKCENFCYWDRPLIGLAGLTMGVVGFGHIGKAVARLALAFGMKVVVFTRSPQKVESGEVEYCALDDVFACADVISLHCPLAADTKNLVDERRLKLMKPTSYIINTARGPLIDEQALADALNDGRLAGAALDVLSVEPPPASNPLLAAPRCIITPHMAWAAVSARKRLLDSSIDNLRAFLSGRSKNVVNL